MGVCVCVCACLYGVCVGIYIGCVYTLCLCVCIYMYMYMCIFAEKECSSKVNCPALFLPFFFVFRISLDLVYTSDCIFDCLIHHPFKPLFRAGRRKKGSFSFTKRTKEGWFFFSSPLLRYLAKAFASRLHCCFSKKKKKKTIGSCTFRKSLLL